MAESQNKIVDALVAGNVVMARDIRAMHLPAPTPQAMAGLPCEEVFAGRDEHCAALDAMLAPGTDAARAIVVSTIAGPPGVGKTALAVHAAWRAVDAGWFTGGVLFLDLHGYDRLRRIGAESALAIFLRALGVPGEQIPPEPAAREALYRSVLVSLAQRGQRVLVVVDNAATLDQVLQLRPGSPLHRMLVTSRHTLPLPGARRIEIDVLSAADAVETLRLSLQAANPVDDRVTGDPKAAAELARLCGHLPLALRISAELLADQPERSITQLNDILAGTHTRLNELVYGESIEIRAVFDASYHHLPADQARLFRLLSLNPGPHVSLDAAVALADRPENVTRHALDGLRRAHLVRSTPGGYSLHDLLRLYSEECCQREDAESDRNAAIARLLDYYRDTLREVSQHLTSTAVWWPLYYFPMRPPSSEDRNKALAWLDSEKSNVVSGVALAADFGLRSHIRDMARALRDFFDLRKHRTDWIATCQLALDVARQSPRDTIGEAWALHDLGLAYRETRRLDDAMECLDEAVLIWQCLDDRNCEAIVMNDLGLVLEDLRGCNDGLDRRQQSHIIYDNGTEPFTYVSALQTFADAHRFSRRFDEALDCYEQLLTICRNSADRRGEAWILGGLAEMRFDQRRFSDALSYYNLTLALYRELGDRHNESITLHNLGCAFRALDHFSEALEHYEQSLIIRCELGDRYGEALTLRGSAGCCRSLLRVDDALDRYYRAQNAFSEVGAIRETFATRAEFAACCIERNSGEREL